MAVGIHPHSPPTLSPASEQGYIGQIVTALIDVVKYIWAQVLWLIEGIFHCATCSRFAPAMPPATDLAQPPQATGRSPTPLVGETDLVSMRTRDQYPLRGLPTDTIQLIFVQCLFKGDIKAFKALSRTNVHSYATMRKLVNEFALTNLCPNLRILNAKTYTFQADLVTVDKYHSLQSYYMLEPFVEGREGLTIMFNHGRLTLKDMKENNCGISIHISPNTISEELDNIPEGDTGPEMISNAPITETREKIPEVQETRVRNEVGFDGKPTLIQYLALVIATQKNLGICLYGEENLTYGRTSTTVNDCPLIVGGSDLGRIDVDRIRWEDEVFGAGGRRKL